MNKAIVTLGLVGLIFVSSVSHAVMKLAISKNGATLAIKKSQNPTATNDFYTSAPQSEESCLHHPVIVKDGIALIVNKSNPVPNLSLAQVQKIYTGEYTNWKDVGGPDLKIVVVNRETGSSIRSRFETLVFGKKLINNGNCLIQSSTGSVQLAVAFTKQAIGYLSLDSLNSKVVRAIPIGNQSLPVKKVVTNKIPPPKTTALKKTYLTKSF